MRKFIARGALKHLNKIRAREGLNPVEILPPGNRSEARSCVLANALPGGSVGGQFIEINGHTYAHSFLSKRFIRMFDAGFFPEFDSSRACKETERRKLCESASQRRQRQRAERADEEAKSVVAQLRKSEETSADLRRQLEAALARENELKAKYERDIEAERNISDRLESRLAEQRRESAQRIAELEHETVTPTESPESPEVREEPAVKV